MIRVNVHIGLKENLGRPVLVKPQSSNSDKLGIKRIKSADIKRKCSLFTILYEKVSNYRILISENKSLWSM